jgi:hypothetical protein
MDARRIAGLFVGLVGLGAVILNRPFGRASVSSSRDLFGVNVREGTRLHKFTVDYSRVMAIVVGSAMAVLGFLTAAGVL